MKDIIRDFFYSKRNEASRARNSRSQSSSTVNDLTIHDEKQSMSSPAISVAMATYNGGSHVRQQLESILGQRHPPLELVICDDGSSDDTLRYIYEFRDRAPFPVHIYRNPANLGYADNFFKAATLCKGDWVAFCDQDDVWLPNRLSDAAKAICDHPEVILVLQKAFKCDENLIPDKTVFPNRIKPGVHNAASQYGVWVWPGFVQTFRLKELKSLQPDKRPKDFYPGYPTLPHDKWTCLIANSTGGFVVIPEPAVLYRRHERSLTFSHKKRNARNMVSESLLIGADHYMFLSGVALNTAEYLRSLSENVDAGMARDFVRSAGAFEKLAAIQATRAKLYSGGAVVSRLGSFTYILVTGGYWGPAMTAMGWKSAGKDLLAALGFLRDPTRGDA